MLPLLLIITVHTIAGIANTGEKVVNALADLFGADHVPPPDPVVKTWPFGDQGKPSWEQYQDESASLPQTGAQLEALVCCIGATPVLQTNSRR